MTNNEILRSLRYVLNVGEGGVIAILRLADLEVSLEDVIAYLKKEGDEGYKECPHRVMSHFLNGMVTHKRGKDPSRPPQPLEVPVTNNTVLKKVRVAFMLKDTDIIDLIQASGLVVTKAELGAFFRQADHRNFRECGDQFLRYVLKGISAKGD